MLAPELAIGGQAFLVVTLFKAPVGLGLLGPEAGIGVTFLILTVAIEAFLIQAVALQAV